MHLILRIDGMGCGHCVATVEKALTKLEGVSVRRVQLGAAEIDYDPGRTSFERIREAIDGAGYSAHPVECAEALA